MELICVVIQTKLMGYKTLQSMRWKSMFQCNQWRTQEFCSEWGVQQIQVWTEDRENGDLGAAAPYSGVLEAAVIWYKKFHFI